MGRLGWLLGGLFWSGLSAATIATYTENESAQDKIALGFPVPLPAASQTAFAGFRDYPSLIDQLTALAFQETDFDLLRLGASRQNREVLGFRFGTPDRPAILQVGGVHAREWASPEAVSHIAEQLVAGLPQHGIERFLADTLSILLIPVLNPDGFISSQTEPARTRVNEDPGGDPATPRGGRMRRKNLRDTDGDLNRPDTNLLGVDLNRNIGRFCGTSLRSSSNPQSVVYHGDCLSPEPETTTLIDAVDRLGANRLRLFIDTHSYGRTYFYNDTGNSRLLELTRALADLIRRVPTTNYAQQVEPSLRGIGANDEYFAYELAVPSYTLELEPGTERQTAEYGGIPNVSHSGFILPEAQVPRMRDEVYQMALLAYYHQAGPPFLQGIQVHDANTQELLVEGAWQDGNAGRELSFSQNQALTPGHRYALSLHFNKPMRLRDQNQQIRNYPGQLVTLEPAVTLIGQGRSQNLDDAPGQWLDRRYQADSYRLEFTAGQNLGDTAQLQVTARDLSGHALDSQPGTPADWAQGHWVAYEDETGNNRSGGEDRQFSLRFQARSENPSPSGGGGGSLGLGLVCAWLLRSRRRGRHPSSAKP